MAEQQYDIGMIGLGVMGRNSDNRLIFAKLGWQPSNPLRDGMEKTYTWIKKQVEEAEQH